MPLAAGNKLTAARINAIGRLVGQVTWTTDSVTFNTSPVLLQSLTVPAFSGVQYWCVGDAGWTNDALATAQFRIHVAGGASVTTGAARKYARKRRVHTAGSFDAFEFHSEVFSDVAPVSGQLTFGLFGLNDAGSGKLEADADNVGWMAVFAIGNA